MAASNNHRPDILVIGSGPIGVAVALRLAARGLSVTILDGGTARTGPDGAHLRNQQRFRDAPDGYFAAVQPYLDPVCPPGADNPAPGLADSALLGGQGVLWTNNCPRVADFERWEAMSPAEWDRWYAEAEAALLVEADAAAASRAGAVLRDRIEATLASDGRALRGLPLAGRLNADGSVHYAAPCDMLAAAPESARARISIRTGVTVTRLHGDDGRIAGVETRAADGSETMFDAATVILAGGAIATPRLLARSGLGGEALGRGLSFHAIRTGQAVIDGDGLPDAGAADIASRLWIPPTPQAPWHIQIGRDTCLLPASEPVDNPHRLVDIRAFVPVTFRDENALLFDEAGDPTIRFAFCEEDAVNMAAMAEDLDTLVEQVGHWRAGCEPRWSPHGNAHPVGTCRMDRPGWPGIADPLGRVHSVDNLWLATTGLIPAPFAVNPTLTATALALRTCEAIAG